MAVYLTGKELKAAMEVDASVTPIMPAAQLYMSGAKYAFNTKRMFFNRVYDAALTDVTFDESGTGNAYEIDDNALYRVVTGMYSAQMLGTVKSKSMGLLSLEPKQANGTPVTDFADCILYDANGNELKEWYALAAYLEQFGRMASLTATPPPPTAASRCPTASHRDSFWLDGTGSRGRCWGSYC